MRTIDSKAAIAKLGPLALPPELIAKAISLSELILFSMASRERYQAYKTLINNPESLHILISNADLIDVINVLHSNNILATAIRTHIPFDTLATLKTKFPFCCPPNGVPGYGEQQGREIVKRTALTIAYYQVTFIPELRVAIQYEGAAENVQRMVDRFPLYKSLFGQVANINLLFNLLIIYPPSLELIRYKRTTLNRNHVVFFPAPFENDMKSLNPETICRLLRCRALQ